jgi:RecJ-like exonuclease
MRTFLVFSSLVTPRARLSMDKATPRVTHDNLSKYINKTIRVVGKVLNVKQPLHFSTDLNLCL